MKRTAWLLMALLLLVGCARQAAAPAVPINEDHIFYGGVNHRGEAVGFHYRATGEAAGRARVVPGTETPPDRHGVYQADVEIKDRRGGGWIRKHGFSTFYPDSWRKEQVLEEIRGAFANARRRGDQWEGVSPSGVRISGYVGQDGTITTAFPIRER